MSFDGTNDEIDVGRLTFTETAGAFSFSGWINQDTLDLYDFIYSKSVSTDSFGLYSYTDGNMYIEVNGSTNRGYIDYSAYMTAGEWTHLTLVFDGSGVGNSGRLKIYFDGVEQTLTYAGTIGATTSSGTGNMKLGISSASTQPFAGKLDEIGMWSKALTQAEVTELYTTSEGLRFRGKFQDSSTLSDVDHYFSFENAAEDDVGSLSGTVTGPTKVTTGIMGNAYDFDGSNDYIDTGLDLDTSGDFAISCWIKLEAIGGSISPTIIANTDDTANKGITIRVNHTGAGQDLHIVADDSSDFDTNKTINTGTWYHLVISHESGTTTAYVDGTSEGTPQAMTYTDTTNNLFFGKEPSRGRYWDGIISNVGIWSRALTSDEVTELYNSGLGLRLN
jgi:hypothetical protein